MLRMPATASQMRPHSRARGARMIRKSPGNHFIHVAIAQSRPARRGSADWAPQSMNTRKMSMLPVSRLAADREDQQEERHGRREGPPAVGPVEAPQEQHDRAAPPDDPGHVPRQYGPGREEREHPRGVDVGQERPRGVVRVAAVEPDPDGRPVRPGVGAGRVAAGHDRCGHEPADRDDDRHREQAPAIAQVRGLAAERAPEHAGVAIERAIRRRRTWPRHSRTRTASKPRFGRPPRAAGSLRPGRLP